MDDPVRAIQETASPVTKDGRQASASGTQPSPHQTFLLVLSHNHRDKDDL
jgi:hypothetical protein